VVVVVVVVVVVLQFWGVPGSKIRIPPVRDSPLETGPHLVEQPLRGATDPPELCRPLRLGPPESSRSETAKHKEVHAEGF
jgi:hypothetical protein